MVAVNNGVVVEIILSMWDLAFSVFVVSSQTIIRPAMIRTCSWSSAQFVMLIFSSGSLVGENNEALGLKHFLEHCLEFSFCILSFWLQPFFNFVFSSAL